MLHLVIGHSLLTLVSEVINIRLKRLHLVYNYSVRISKAWYLEAKTFRVCSSVFKSWYYKVIPKISLNVCVVVVVYMHASTCMPFCSGICVCVCDVYNALSNKIIQWSPNS